MAVLDNGVQTTHEDLAVNMLPGYNFVHNSSNVYPVPPEEPAGGNAATEGHGTSVTGIIAAAKDNNRTGIVGVAPDAEIIPLKTMGNINGTIDANIEHAIDAIQYAIEHGAKIINNSWGSTVPNSDLENLIQSNPNVLFVCAAGNDNKNMEILANREYPSCYDYPNNLSVTQMNNQGYKTQRGSYGYNTKLAAPGVDVYTTGPDDTYCYFRGTSAAAPFVSGVAALIWSYFPSLTAAQVASRIANNVTPSFNLQDFVTSGGYLNAFKAFANENPAPSALASSPVAPKSSAELKAEITARADLIPDDVKVNRIFVNLFDETQIDRVLSENLQGFQYEIVNHFSMTGSYVVEFDSITAAEEAVTILNTLEEVNYAEISVKIKIY